MTRIRPTRLVAALAGVGVLAVTGCGLQPATAYVPAVATTTADAFAGARSRLLDILGSLRRRG